MRFRISVLLTLLAVILSTALLVTSAQAATCSGSGCTGLDPAATDCDDDEIWISGTSLADGYVHLMWSPTCETVWSRIVTSSNNSGATYWAYMQSTLNFGYGVSAASAVWWDPSNPGCHDSSGGSYFRDGTMYHRSHARVTNGVKACGRITGVATDKCIPYAIDPDDLVGVTCP